MNMIESFKEWAVALMEYAYEDRKQGNEYGYEYQRNQVLDGLDDLSNDINDSELASLEKWVKLIK